jgi:hypothetical protein
MQKNPAQRFSTMDELVNVLIHIYRGIVGPGMSTYMEAFPVMPSSAHQVQPTPPPMTRPVGIGQGGGHGVGQSVGVHAITGPSGSTPMVTPGGGMQSPGYATGPGASLAMPRRSKAGLIIAVLAVLAVGGGVAAFVIVNNKGQDPGKGSGSDKGSQVVIADGSDRGSSRGSDRGSDRGSGAVPTDGSGSAKTPQDGSGSAGAADAGSGHAGSDVGSGSAETHDGSDAGSNAPPPVEVVHVPMFARNGVAFEVYENGTKLFDGPDNLEVPKGEKRTVVIKARGFKDKTLVVEGKKKKVQFSLERIAAPPGPGSGHVPPPPPPGPSCANAIADPTSKACVAQYCAKHPDDQAKCGLE